MIKHLFATFLISMVPVVELRGGLPYGIALGLDYPVALLAALIGNMIPAPVVIRYARSALEWLRKKSAWLDRMVSALERRGCGPARWWRLFWGCGLNRPCRQFLWDSVSPPAL